MEIIEVGETARAALNRSRRCQVVMTFSRGVVLQTDAGEVIWLDRDPDAFSPCGMTIRSTRMEQTETPVEVTRDLTDDAVDGEITTFTHAMRDGRSLAEAAPRLLGLGRGLTPAGDDFLGGFVCARHHLGATQTFDTSATHAISRTRLGMHLRGEGTRAEVRAVRALISGSDLSDATRSLQRLGHTSGRDFLRGARVALDVHGVATGARA